MIKLIPCLFILLQSSSWIDGHRRFSFNLDDWSTFKSMHNKSFNESWKEKFHRDSFFANLGRIHNHNIQADKGLELYRLGTNRYSDMEFSDFARKVLNYKPITRNPSRFHHYNRATIKSTQLNQTRTFGRVEEIDWRSKGYVARVKDQGTCGSCWAFASIAAIEGSIALVNNSLVKPLSEQNLVDCSLDQGNEGCVGGNLESSYQYVLDNRGVNTEESYPYEDGQGVCRFNPATVGATIKSYVTINPGAEDDLVDALTNHIVSVAIQATPRFQLYRSGIFDDPACDDYNMEALNHAVALVGYGTSNGQDYWLVKNSWGTSWGEDGYGRIARGKNTCGIALQASYPII